MTLFDWFQYQDRDKFPYNPIANSMVTVDKFSRQAEGKVDSYNWKSEEWLTRAALVPIQELERMATTVRDPHCLEFNIGWNHEDDFNFGSYSVSRELPLYPLISQIKHPITEELIVEINQKFIRYHALQKQGEFKYYHPKDNILVAEIGIDNHEFYNSTPRVTIYKDYLRDFLSAIKMGLLISVISDRFANALTQEELGISNIQDSQIEEFTWRSERIEFIEKKENKYFSGRSILRRNIIVKPYDKPKFSRSPWYYPGKKNVEEANRPKFIINDEGEEQILFSNTYMGNHISIGKYGYLYFRPEVLKKYLETEGYTINFHMRNWGIACLPGISKTIDVGINSHGLVTAFAPDIADLDIQEQSYWSSYSSLPSGEICEELFQTRMQCRPPHSPGLNELIREARSQLNTVCASQFQATLFKDIEPSDQDLNKLSIGVISSQYDEVLEMAKTLYGWVIETMEVTPLRNIMKALGGTVNKDLKQIKLIEKILVTTGIDLEQARLITAPLVGLNELRIGAAHIGSTDLEKNFVLMGSSIMPSTPRAAWNVCIDAVAKCLHEIAHILQTVNVDITLDHE